MIVLNVQKPSENKNNDCMILKEEIICGVVNDELDFQSGDILKNA